MYLSIRTYRVPPEAVDELARKVDRGLADTFAREPGFISYEVVRTSDHAVASVTVFREREQAEASNDLAAEWVADELEGVAIERLGVIGGEVLVSRAVDAALTA